MSWVPSPSGQLIASYREARPGAASGAVAMAVAATSSPGTDRFAFGGMRPVASRQGSYTPQPVATSATVPGRSPNVGHGAFGGAVFSPSARPLRGSSPAPPDHPRRSYTPSVSVHPVGSPLKAAADDQLSHSLTNLVMPAGIASAGGILASPAPVRCPLDASYQRQQDWNVSSRSSICASQDLARRAPRPRTVSPQPTHRPEYRQEEMILDTPCARERPREVPFQSPLEAQVARPVEVYRHEPQTPSALRAADTEALRQAVPVNLNVYWQRSVAYDANGRVERRLGSELTLPMRIVKDIMGVYHVGVEVHGDEYSFGIYHAPKAKQVGDESSGVCRHEPQRPGPGFVFKQATSLGTTIMSKEQVEDICAELGNRDFGRSSYNLIHHNCVDFCRNLSEKLGVGEIPLWCYRGAATAKLLGIGGEPPAQDGGAPMQDGGNENAVHLANASAMEYRYEPEHYISASSPKAVDQQIQQVNMDPEATAMAAIEQLSIVPNGLEVGRSVAVLQSMGQWSNALIVSKDPDGKYTVAYIDTGATEGVAPQRLVPQPEAPRLDHQVHLDALPRDLAPDEPHALPSSLGRRPFLEPKAAAPCREPPLQGLFAAGSPNGSPVGGPGVQGFPAFLPVQPAAPPPPGPSHPAPQVPQRMPTAGPPANAVPVRYSPAATMPAPMMTAFAPLQTVCRGGVPQMHQPPMSVGVGANHQFKDLNSTWRW